MRWMKLYKLLPLLVLLFSAEVKAQFFNPCIDSTQINTFLPCYDQGFSPICGCDGKLYFNDCSGRNYGGIANNNYQDIERCPENVYYIAPTYPQESIHFYFYTRTAFSGYVRIFDLYGRIWYQQSIIVSSGPFQFYPYMLIDVSSLNPGVYFLSVVGNTPYRVTRFVKTPVG